MTPTNVAFIFGPNAPRIDFDGTIHLYEGSAAMRRSFDLAERCTGVSVDVLLRKRDIPDDESLMRMNSIALAAASFGISDVLAEMRLFPSVTGGLSLGDMLATSAAGAIARADMFKILYFSRHDPISSEPGQEETMAFAFVPADLDPAPYIQPTVEGVYFAGSLGKPPWGDGDAVIFSGYRAALEEFARQHPEVRIKLRDQRVTSAAYHSPMRLLASAQLERILDQVSIRDSALPICTSMLDEPITAAADIRDFVLRNCLEPVWASKMIEQVTSFQPELVVTIGPAMAKGMFAFPVPLVHVDSPETLADLEAVLAEGGHPAGGRGSTATMRSSQV